MTGNYNLVRAVVLKKRPENGYCGQLQWEMAAFFSQISPGRDAMLASLMKKDMSKSSAVMIFIVYTHSLQDEILPIILMIKSIFPHIF